MANVIFTNKCNISCPFCFATENNLDKGNSERSDFSIGDTWKVANYLSSKDFRFCGGEPTQNSNIVECVDLLLKGKYNILIMTNGIWENNFLEYIKTLPLQYLNKVGYLFNILHPSFYTDVQLIQIMSTLSIVNPLNATLGMTIYKKDFEYQYLIDLAKKFKIGKIRWSVTAPNISSGEYQMEKHFSEISDRIFNFLMATKKEGINTHCDCGFVPPCFYDKNKLVELNLQLSEPMKFQCKGSAVDIDVHGNAWRCYGLFSVLKTNVDNFKNETELRNYFTRRVKILDNIYPYSACKNCNYWQASCNGGCYAIRVKKVLQEKKDVVLFPIDNEHAIFDCMPHKVKNVQIKERDRNSYILSKGKVISHPDENKIAYLKEIDGTKTVRDLIELWKGNFSSYQNAEKDVVEMTRLLFDADMIEIKYDYGVNL